MDPYMYIYIYIYMYMYTVYGIYNSKIGSWIDGFYEFSLRIGYKLVRNSTGVHLYLPTIEENLWSGMTHTMQSHQLKNCLCAYHNDMYFSSKLCSLTLMSLNLQLLWSLACSSILLTLAAAETWTGQPARTCLLKADPKWYVHCSSTSWGAGLCTPITPHINW